MEPDKTHRNGDAPSTASAHADDARFRIWVHAATEIVRSPVGRVAGKPSARRVATRYHCYGTTASPRAALPQDVEASGNDIIRPLRNVAVLLFRGMAEHGDGMFTRTSESQVVGVEPIKAARSTRLPTHEVDPEASDRSVIGNDLRILGKGLKITGRGVLQI